MGGCNVGKVMTRSGVATGFYLKVSTLGGRSLAVAKGPNEGVSALQQLQHLLLACIRLRKHRSGSLLNDLGARQV